MDVKLFMTVLAWIGIPGSIAAFVLNINNWKSDFTFWVGVTAFLIRLAFWGWEKWQRIREREIDIKMKARQMERDYPSSHQ